MTMLEFVPPEPGAGLPGSDYVFSIQATWAVNVALTIDRPLLVTGNPGTGKTSLSKKVAQVLGWRFLSMTVTSRTQLELLQADIDLLRRLAQAQANDLQPDWTYLKPGILWWAFDRAGALRRGASYDEIAHQEGLGKLPPTPEDRGVVYSQTDNAVLLLDEIDKADPDLPNDLLEPLDQRRFDLPLDRGSVKAPRDLRLLIVLTSNRERELPAAFVRRCVTLELPDALPKTRGGGISLEEIAARHFPADNPVSSRFTDVAQLVQAMRDDPDRRGMRPPSTAEYLDTLKVLARYPDLEKQTEIWDQVKALLLAKSPTPQS